MYFNTNDKYITPEEVADELGLSFTTVYNLLRKGQLVKICALSEFMQMAVAARALQQPCFMALTYICAFMLFL